jgi:hypothetical protein
VNWDMIRIATWDRFTRELTSKGIADDKASYSTLKIPLRKPPFLGLHFEKTVDSLVTRFLTGCKAPCTVQSQESPRKYENCRQKEEWKTESQGVRRRWEQSSQICRVGVDCSHDRKKKVVTG